MAAAGVAFALRLPGLAGVLAPLVLLAVGMSLVVAPLTTAVRNAAPDALAGAASGVSNAASRLAGLFSVAFVGTLAGSIYGRAAGNAVPGTTFGAWPVPGSAGYAEASAAFATAYQAGMAACALLALLAAATAILTLGRVTTGKAASGS